MRIGEFAARVGTSPRSLRHYEERGLLSPARDARGYREYDEAALVRARNVRQLLDAGLTVDDVLQYGAAGCLDRPLDADARCAGELDTARRRLESLDERIERLRALRERVARHGEHLTASLPPASDRDHRDHRDPNLYRDPDLDPDPDPDPDLVRGRDLYRDPVPAPVPAAE
ncbi:MerR family transcriptional regulator [Streptomyces sp. NPDC020141]|uniref:MerR family transcriptional regulator n=1 Tax=Streptomyces sp. NPDC020141 TaxID=3365065 RepID=UPI003789569E